MSKQWSTKNGRTSKRGLFVDGIWHCDCEPRLPAEKFQVKNGGKNHGRWFYTCQKPQLKRCSFFLWSDDAKVREEAAVLSNSRNEPSTKPPLPAAPVKKLEAPRTPMRQTKIQPITPVSKPRNIEQEIKSKAGTSKVDDHNESFDWSSSADEELADFAETLESNMTRQLQENTDESPQRATKTFEFASPSKRKHYEMEKQGTMAHESDSDSTELISNDDLFLTPSTSTKSHTNTSGLLSPPPITPAPTRRQLFPQSERRPEDTNQSNLESEPTPSTLALEALSILSPIRSFLSPKIQQELISALNRHDLRTQGIMKGRDIARLAVQAKETKIAELQQRIVALEAEKERSRTVIQHLKTDIATSPKKPRRPRGDSSKRPVV
ncbi:hypothetical protein H2198_004596 [Neophaeococcomyces mojaviensis]|uniref:Uncharacterized protein n=1 Tax=Neophaeococcomyces mojaviensis TaxID=3383035 RepID=A0ACC3A862_9EURO|nr:hypothetical protein H2198_004596 [Knufia sp. JES_112]